MSGKATQCKVCGSKKLEHGAFCAVHWREYRTNNMRASRSAQKAMAARANPQKPIVVNPKKHKARGQQMAPPAPRIEVKPEPVVVPPGFRPKPLVKLEISRWSHEGPDIWTPKL